MNIEIKSFIIITFGLLFCMFPIFNVIGLLIFKKGIDLIDER